MAVMSDRRGGVALTLLGALVMTGCPEQGGNESPTSAVGTQAPTATLAPTATEAATASEALTATAEPTPTAGATLTAEATPTNAPTPTATTAPTPTATSAPTPTATSAPTPTATSAPTPTATSAPTPTASAAPTPTPTLEPTPTATTAPTVAPTPTATEVPTPTAPIDFDGDGAPAATDCDDNNSAIYPGAGEHCDGVDEDCDAVVDEEAVDMTTFYLDGEGDGFAGANSTDACEPPSDAWLTTSDDCDDDLAIVNPDAAELCDAEGEARDEDCDGEVDEGCVPVIVLDPPSLPPVEVPEEASACALIGEVNGAPNPHDVTNMPTQMAILTGETSGLTASANLPSPRTDWSTRCGADYEAAPGNFSPSTPWPVLEPQGAQGAARFRGFINVRPGDPLYVTVGLIGNDALTLKIAGRPIVDVNWLDGRWKKFRYVTFPGPGLYSFEVEWSTNLVCEIDPFEFVWAQGFVEGYGDYDTMCASAACEYNNGEAIPGFMVWEGERLVQSTQGEATSCVQCEDADDCASAGGLGLCNDAGVCE